MPPSSAALTRFGLSAFITPMLTSGTSRPVRPSLRRGGPAGCAGGSSFAGSGALATGIGAGAGAGVAGFCSAATVAHPAAAANPVAPSFKKSRRSSLDLLMQSPGRKYRRGVGETPALAANGAAPAQGGLVAPSQLGVARVPVPGKVWQSPQSRMLAPVVTTR